MTTRNTNSPDTSLIGSPECVPDWDAALSAFPNATIFHTTAWARVLRETYNLIPAFVRCADSDGPRAIIPMMEVNSWLTGRRGVSLPFTDECEPLCRSKADFDAALEPILEHAKARRWKHYEIRGGRLLMQQADESSAYLGHALELGSDTDALFARCRSEVARAVRKAERSQVTVRISHDREDMHCFYRLLCTTRQRLGVPPQPFAFFESIHKHIIAPARGVLALARWNGIPIAGSVFFHFGAQALYKFGASNHAYQHLRAANLVMWTAIKHYAQQGFQTLDFGRTSMGNEGLRRFKLSWGATERPISYFRYSFQTRSFVGSADHSTGWHSRVFQRMPAFLCRAIGSAIYRHVA